MGKLRLKALIPGIVKLLYLYLPITKELHFYQAGIEINGLKTKQHVKLLNCVPALSLIYVVYHYSHLANILVTGGLLYTPGDTFNKINDVTLMTFESNKKH